MYIYVKMLICIHGKQAFFRCTRVDTLQHTAIDCNTLPYNTREDTIVCLNTVWHGVFNTYQWVMTHISMSHGPRINESFRVYSPCHNVQWVTAHISMSHGSHINESRWVISMSHGSHINESRLKYQWVTISLSKDTYLCDWTSHWMFNTYQWVTARVLMSHGSHIWASRIDIRASLPERVAVCCNTRVAVCRNVFELIAVCCSVLQCVTVCCRCACPQVDCIVLQCNCRQRLPLTPFCNTLQHTATHCNTLQHTATHCNTLQHTATHCNTLQHTANRYRVHIFFLAHTYSLLSICLQCVAVCCSVLQCVTTCCSVSYYVSECTLRYKSKSEFWSNLDFFREMRFGGFRGVVFSVESEILATL